MQPVDLPTRPSRSVENEPPLEQEPQLDREPQPDQEPPWETLEPAAPQSIAENPLDTGTPEGAFAQLIAEEQLAEQKGEIPEQSEARILLDADNEVLPQVEQQFASKPPSSLVNSGPLSQATDLHSSEDWISIYSQLPLEGMLKSICGQLSFRNREGDFLTFDIDRAASGVLSDKYQGKFCEILSAHLGQNLSLNIDVQENPNESPTKRAERLLQEALDAAEVELLRSDAVQKLSETFGARLVPGSVNLK